MMVLMSDAAIFLIKEQCKCMVAFIQHYGVRAFILRAIQWIIYNGFCVRYVISFMKLM